MKPKLIILFILSLMGCQIDNYQAPELTLSGDILDAQTNELVESGGVNAGTIVKLYEGDAIQPLLFRTLPEGTFTNSKVFSGSYKLEAEGPFTMLQADPINLEINKNENIEIKVIPHVRLTISIQNQEAGSAKVKLTYEKLAEDQALIDYGIVWSEYQNPNVYSFPGGSILLEKGDAANGEKTFILENLKSNKTYYVRGTARTKNPGNYYNYSPQIMLKMQ